MYSGGGWMADQRLKTKVKSNHDGLNGLKTIITRIKYYLRNHVKMQCSLFYKALKNKYMKCKNEMLIS